MTEWETVLREAAERAKAVCDRYSRDVSGTEKLGRGAGGDMTMRVDREAEDEIVQTLSQMGDVRIVTEESGEVGTARARWTAIVDPLDGSSNFERRVPFYCTSLAVLDGDDLQGARYALVRNLVNGEIYYAERGGEATKDGRRIETTRVGELSECTLGIDICRASLASIERIAGLISSIRRQMHFGAAALEICLLSEGKLDGYVDLRGKMRIMDFAAGYLIAKSAGAVFSGSSGGELKPRIAVDERFDVVAAANEGLQRKVLEKLSQTR